MPGTETAPTLEALDAEANRIKGLQQKKAMEGRTPKPSIGRIVHYVAHGTPGGEFPKTSRAAMVTEVDTIELLMNPDGMKVGLCVVNPQGLFFNHHVRFDGSEDPLGGTWHWPPRT